MREINENAAMRKSIDNDINRHREKVQQQTQAGGEEITPGKLASRILAALLPLPEAAVEQSRDETKKETDQAAA